MKDQYLNAFQAELLEILENRDTGISEYELIRLLGERGHKRFSGSFLGNEPELFRAHFILFIAQLALSEPVEPQTIRKRYRELAFEHHPDRGGSAEKLATINEAMDTLRVYYAL